MSEAFVGNGGITKELISKADISNQTFTIGSSGQVTVATIPRFSDYGEGLTALWLEVLDVVNANYSNVRLNFIGGSTTVSVGNTNSQSNPYNSWLLIPAGYRTFRGWNGTGTATVNHFYIDSNSSFSFVLIGSNGQQTTLSCKIRLWGIKF